ncbi:glycosyltransferase family 4 protein [Pectobacterium brasiliense]|uniref:glycosyltransferase family 4 protein n=1 Tax=Pectobacterium brasiliense TaxID=180957 RepID=UPI00381CF5EF
MPSNKICSPNNIALKIAEGASEKGAIVTVFYLKEFDENILHTKLLMFRKMRIKDFIYLRNFDVVHSHLLKPDFINGIFSLLIKKNRTKTLATIHSNVFLDLSTYIDNKFIAKFVSKIWFFFLNRLSYRVVVSESLGDNQRNELKNYHVIHNGISLNSHESFSFKESLVAKKTASCRMNVGILSRLHPGKGIEDALYLARHAKHVDVSIYGDGKLSELCSLESRKYQNLIFHGFSFDVKSAFKSIDLFLMPSRHEGFGMTILESLKYDVPVICYDLPVFREILGEGDFYYKDEKELLELLERFRFNYEENKKKQINRVPLFNEELMIGKYNEMYE